MAQRLSLRTKLRQAKSQQRLEPAWWFLVIWGVRLSRPSHPSGAAAPTTTQAIEKHPTARPGSGYSWRKPFPRRPPSATTAPAELCAKKETHPTSGPFNCTEDRKSHILQCVA